MRERESARTEYGKRYRLLHAYARETYGFIGGGAAVTALKLSICIIYITYEYIALICLGVLTFIPERSSFVQICICMHRVYVGTTCTRLWLSECASVFNESHRVFVTVYVHK